MDISTSISVDFNEKYEILQCEYINSLKFSQNVKKSQKQIQKFEICNEFRQNFYSDSINIILVDFSIPR